jgi:hypothetical protein
MAVNPLIFSDIPFYLNFSFALVALKQKPLCKLEQANQLLRILAL